MKVYVATTNPGKLGEFRRILDPHGLSVATFAEYENPLEGEASYAENAQLKARALHAQLSRRGIGANVLADDSGLEVYALDRRPGVLTAYYGGPDLSWAQRRRRLLEELRVSKAVDRRARFVCAMHFIGQDGREFGTMGTVDGEIAEGERGDGGFSFDAVFLYPPENRTFGEMTEEEKNVVSHRAIAAAALLAALKASRVQLGVPD